MARTATPPRDAGSREAVFDAWFTRHVEGLRGYAFRLTGDAAVADDVAQETLARAWLHLDDLTDRAEVAPWLYRVARNLCVDSHRARARAVPTAEIPDGPGIEDRSDGADPARHVMREEERRLVRDALTTLTDRHRDVLYLRDIVGLDYEELGARHGLSATSARAVIARARRRLRDELKVIGQGVFGLGVAFRTRLEAALRRAGGDRVAVEPVAAVLSQYAVAAAAAVALTFGSAPGRPAPEPAPPAPASAVAPADDPVGPSGNAPEGSVAPGDRPDGPSESGSGGADPALVVHAGPGPESGFEGSPLDPDGDGAWIEGTVVSVHPEHSPLGTEPVFRGAADGLCGAGGEVCP